MSVRCRDERSCIFSGRGNHSFALCDDGLYAWGRNSHGQLGLGGGQGKDPERSPVKVPLPDVVSVRVGWEFTVALTRYNELYSWGANQHGQLGIGTAKAEDYPKLVTGLEGRVISYSCGESHCVVLTSSGVYAWGDNNFGQVGTQDDTYRDVRSPHKIASFGNGKKIHSVVCGASHSVALANNKTLYVWGNDSDGQLGLGGDLKKNYWPRKLKFPKKIRSVACGDLHTMVITTEGVPYVWGCNREDQLGLANVSIQHEPCIFPTSVFKDDKIVDFFCGGLHCFALTESGKLYGWGYNSYCQQGIYLAEYKTGFTPMYVHGIPKPIISVAPGYNHTIVHSQYGVYGFGRSEDGEVGHAAGKEVARIVFPSPLKMLWIARDLYVILDYLNKEHEYWCLLPKELLFLICNLLTY